MKDRDLFVLVKIDTATGYAKGTTGEKFTSREAAEKAIPAQDISYNYRVERY